MQNVEPQGGFTRAGQAGEDCQLVLRNRNGEPNWELNEAISKLSVPKKNERAFTAADFALRGGVPFVSEINGRSRKNHVDIQPL